MTIICALHKPGYGKTLFERAAFEHLSETLKSLQGRFLLSLNDRRPETRRIFSDFQIQEVTTTYQLPGANQPVTELVITDRKK